MEVVKSSSEPLEEGKENELENALDKLRKKPKVINNRITEISKTREEDFGDLPW